MAAEPLVKPFDLEKIGEQAKILSARGVELSKEYGSKAAVVIKEKSEVAKVATMSFYSELKQAGAFDHTQGFNMALVRPLKEFKLEPLPHYVDETKKIVSCMPTNPEAGFVLSNSGAFYCDIVGSVLALVTGNFLGSLLGLAFGYMIAYSLYFLIVMSKNKRYVFYATAGIAVLLILDVLCLGSSGLTMPLVLLKTVLHGLMMVHAFAIYKEFNEALMAQSLPQ